MWNSLSNISFYDNLLDQKEYNGKKLSDFEVDINKLCRTCLREAQDENNLLKDFEIGAMNINLDGKLLKMFDMLKEVTGLDINDTDLLPHQICTNCIQNVSGAYFFRLQTHKAEKTLLRLLEEIKFLKNDNKIIENDSDLEYLDESQNDGESQKEEEESTSDTIRCQLMEIELDGVEYKIENFLDNEIRENEERIERLEDEEVDNPEFQQENDTELSDTIEDFQIEYIEKTDDENDEIKSQTDSNNTDEYKIEKQIPLKDEIYCSQCNENFGRKKDLNEHIQSFHPESKLYECEVCNSRFSKMQTLKRHMKIHQDDQKNKLCTYCGKRFTRADDLKRHIRIHTGERPYPCSICPKRYKQTSELKEHMITHSKEKSFICTICGKCLQTRNGHYVHMKAHKGVKNHVCQICNNRYVTSGELTSHIKHIHDKKRPFKCSIRKCERSFTTKISLEIHERAHNGERPYICLICGKRLATASSLADHKRIHTGEKRSICTICGKSFSNAQTLKKHMRIHGDTTNIENLKEYEMIVKLDGDPIAGRNDARIRKFQTKQFIKQEKDITYDIDVVNDSDEIFITETNHNDNIISEYLES